MRKIGFAILISALVFAVGCGGSSGSSNNNNNNTSSTKTVAECIQFLDNSYFWGSVRLADVRMGGTTLGGTAVNVAPLTVNAGPVTSNPQSNVAFTTVQVCTPGTSTCVTIDNVAVDTGSSGLRIPYSLLSTLNLPAITLNSITPASGGTSNGSELASSVPIHVMGDTSIPTGASIPTTCSQVTPLGGSSTITGTEEDDVAHLGANGLIGVGNYIYDCDVVGNPAAGTNGCSSNSTPPTGMYYTCTSSSCSPSLVPASQQVRNPVSLFTDNNGVILKLQTVPAGGQLSATGTMVFGIGTSANNGLGSATVLTIDSNTNDPAWSGITTVYNGVSYPNSTSAFGSFFDSGSNGMYFLDTPTSGIPDCTGSILDYYYCPASSPTSYSAINKSSNGSSGNSSTVNFSISAASGLNGNYTAFSDLAGPNTPGTSLSTSTKAADGFFDWGLPFFYGKSVYTAIWGVTPPSGVQAGPWWAY